MNPFAAFAAGSGQGGSGAAPDVTPAAMNWGNISGTGSGDNSASTQTLSGINTTITLRASWSASFTNGQWYKNGSPVGFSTTSPVDVSVVNGDTLYFEMDCASPPESGTVTITNQSDGAAVLDTFTFNLT